MKILIPARGGSKRIPRKNLLDLNSKPLLYYSIRQSLNITNEVYVSTEDSEIQEFVNDRDSVQLELQNLQGYRKGGKIQPTRTTPIPMRRR